MFCGFYESHCNVGFLNLNVGNHVQRELEPCQLSVVCTLFLPSNLDIQVLLTRQKLNKEFTEPLLMPLNAQACQFQFTTVKLKTNDTIF